jgi:recombination protein RecR
MSMRGYPSRILEQAVNEFSRLPGIGHRTALRLVLYLLKQNKEIIKGFGNTILQLAEEVVYCEVCHNLSDSGICPVCADKSRDHSTVCVVENVRDVMSIEATQQYRGVYHVLGGIISPMEGVGPGDLNVESLVRRMDNGHIKELILALPTTMEGDTTNFYLYRKMNAFQTTISTIARGVSIGDHLEYIDEITLGRSIVNRTPFENSLSKA